MMSPTTTTDELARTDALPGESAILSPRIRKLAADLASASESDPAPILDAFWQEASAGQGPLVEPSPTSPRACLVTFVWREVQPIDHIVVIEWMTQGDFKDKLMTHLPGSDVWYRTLDVRRDIRTDYQFAPNDSLRTREEETDWPSRFAAWGPDPLNPRRLRVDPDAHRQSSVLELPDAPPQPWIVQHPEHPAGHIDHHRFASAILDNERDVWVYVPHECYRTEEPADVLLHFDGDDCLGGMELPTVLDNLHAAGAIRPTIALMVGNVDRGNELPCNARFARMLATELLPWLAERYSVTDDPRRRVAAGQSYGGLASAWLALQHPGAVANVISQSGSFWWKPNPLNEGDVLVIGDNPEYEWLTRRVAEMPTQPIRLYLEAGLLEHRSFRSYAPSLLIANRHMRDMLLSKGYGVAYREFSGGHDYACWRNSLGDAMVLMMGPR